MGKCNYLITLFGAASYLVSTQACSADVQKQSISNNEKESAMECSDMSISDDKLPENVLVATDIESVENYGRGQPKAGNYYSEMGGSEVLVSVEAVDDSFRITREFSEPTLPTKSETFSLHCSEGGSVYGDRAVARFVEGGILWLEQESSDDLLSPELWIYLEMMP